MKKSTSKAEKKQESRELERRCWEFLKPFLEGMHKHMDRRLVKTLLDLVLVILMHRHRNNGLLLSELGDHLMGGDRGGGRGEADCQFAALCEMEKRPDLEVSVESSE